MALNYLRFVRAALTESIKHENSWVRISSSPISEEEYDEQTKWSDFNIIIPLLFNFYHGLELLLKGFVLLKQAEDRRLDHDIEMLLTTFRSSYPDQSELGSILAKYIERSTSPDLLREFFDENRCSANRFYEVLRYPFDKKLASRFAHHCLKHRQRASLPFFKSMVADIDAICRCSVHLGRSHEPSA
jgi:hypothetical protein